MWSSGLVFLPIADVWNLLDPAICQIKTKLNRVFVHNYMELTGVDWTVVCPFMLIWL